MTDVIAFTKELIKRPSITPDDMGCQDMIIDELTQAGFQIKKLTLGKVSNLYAWHGTGTPSIIFAGHTDVVPPGPLDAWQSDPFKPTEKNGDLYGRGAADMKAAVAAMVLSAKNFAEQHPDHPGCIGLVITSDEEGPATDGTIKVVEYLQQQNLIPNYVIVGEASSNETIGDAIKIGRRGSMSGEITIIGKQGHIAYPDKALNPIHTGFEALNQLAITEWDQGNAHYPPSSFQFYDIQAGVGASNVIPANLTAKFNIRFAPMSTPEALQQQIIKTLKNANLKFDIQFNVSSVPYFSGECHLSEICQQAIGDVCGIKTKPNTHGGTSDGRHFAPLGSEVIELGAVNKSIHKANEHINIAELKLLEQVYARILNLILV